MAVSFGRRLYTERLVDGRLIAGIFRLVNAGGDDYRLRFRGVDPARRYRVTTEPDGLVRVLDGHALGDAGLSLRLDTALTSRLILCAATE